MQHDLVLFKAEPCLQILIFMFLIFHLYVGKTGTQVPQTGTEVVKTGA